MMMKQYFSLLLMLLAWSVAKAELTLALPFGDHAVLQHGKPLPVWGTADAGAEISVKLGEKILKTNASDAGEWKVEFPASKPSKNGTVLEVSSGADSIVRKDLLFGDVWLASGQSNMAWMLKQCASGKDAISNAGDQHLRLFRMSGTLHPGSKKYSVEFLKKMTPENYYATEGWQADGPESAPPFSGVAYFFAKKLRKELDIPVGVICLAVGGTPMEAHMPRSAFLGDDDLAPLLEKWWSNPSYPKWCRGRAALNLTKWNVAPASETAGMDPPHPFAPTYLWRAGVQRVIPFPVKGIIWYHGESNAGKDGTPAASRDGSLNKKKFKLLIESWRSAWGDENLPVYYVQLPGMNRQWSVFREMQLEVSKEVKHVGMAVTIDVGHPTNVHPAQKLPVGERLARLALAGVYGKDNVPTGPIYESSKAMDGKIGRVVIRFSHGEGLKTSDGKSVRGFEIAGVDKKFLPARVFIYKDRVEVSHEKMSTPVAVRYGWANDPDCNLVNAEGLPASPFRTDRWKIAVPNQKNKIKNNTKN